MQVGETRRFVDEIEYLMDGLVVEQTTNATMRAANMQCICDSLAEIVEKCLPVGSTAFDVGGFGLKLKSHGILTRIFDQLAPGGQLVDNDVVRLKLLILIAGLLHGVRRTDFFCEDPVIVTLAQFCLLTESTRLARLDKGDLVRIRTTALFVSVDAATWPAHQVSFDLFAGLAPHASTDDGIDWHLAADQNVSCVHHHQSTR